MENIPPEVLTNILYKAAEPNTIMVCKQWRQDSISVQLQLKRCRALRRITNLLLHEESDKMGDLLANQGNIENDAMLMGFAPVIPGLADVQFLETNGHPNIRQMSRDDCQETCNSIWNSYEQQASFQKFGALCRKRRDMLNLDVEEKSVLVVCSQPTGHEFTNIRERWCG